MFEQEGEREMGFASSPGWSKSLWSREQVFCFEDVGG